MKYLTLILALKKGYALKNASTWKNASVATALLTSILSAVLTVAAPDLLDDTVVSEFAGGVVALVTFAIGYLGVATDENMGA